MTGLAGTRVDGYEKGRHVQVTGQKLSTLVLTSSASSVKLARFHSILFIYLAPRGSAFNQSFSLSVAYDV